MKTYLFLFAAAATSIGFGQGASSRDADFQWNEILRLRSPSTPANPGSGPKSRAQAEQEKKKKAESARALSATARNFYSAYPAHPYAAQARKIEALSALEGVLDGDPAQEAGAQAIARAYRNDANNPLADRFSVAVLAEHVAARAKIKGAVDTRNSAALEAMAAALQREFGDCAEVFNFYASIARSSDMATARRAAAKLNQPNVQPEARAEGQAVEARDAMLGQRLSLRITSIGGEVIDLSQPSGKPVVLFFTTHGSGATHGLSALALTKKALPADARVIYVVREATAAQIEAMKALAPVAGTFCADKSEIGSIAERLNVRRTPYLFVLNDAGLVSGFGPVGELNNLIAAAR